MGLAFASASTEYLEGLSGLGNPTNLTLACWVKAASTGSEQGLLSLGADGSGNDYRGLLLKNTGEPRVRSRSTFGSVATHGSTVSTGVWAHVGASFTGDSSRFAYLNGVASSEYTTTVSPGTPDVVAVGALGGSGGSPADASIAEPAAWSVNLTQSEWDALAAGVSPLLVRPDALLMYLMLIGDVYVDVISGLSFSATGTPTVDDHPPIIYPSGPLFVPYAVPVTQGGYVSYLPGFLSMMGAVPVAPASTKPFFFNHVLPRRCA